MEINILAQLVAPGTGDHGARVSLGSNTDVTLDLRGYVAARRASGKPVAVAAEVNANLPYMPGEAEVERGEFDVMLEPEGAAFDLFAPPKEPVSLADYAMALRAATRVKDGGTLQIGIGSFSDALAHALILRHANNAAFCSLLDRLGHSPSVCLGTYAHVFEELGAGAIDSEHAILAARLKLGAKQVLSRGFR